jgi:hypothetical protein
VLQELNFHPGSFANVPYPRASSLYFLSLTFLICVMIPTSADFQNCCEHQWAKALEGLWKLPKVKELLQPYNVLEAPLPGVGSLSS